jgi:hypothetical protein
MEQLAPQLSDREVRRVSRAAGVAELKAKEKASAVESGLDPAGADVELLAGWDPSRLRQFRAGVMRVEAEGKRLRPLPDKGVLLLEKSESDGFTHLLWTPREDAVHTSGSGSASSQKAVDLLLLPGDTTISRVTEFSGHPVTGARIYSITYDDGDAYYFWMQEPSIEADDVLFNRINHVLHPPLYASDTPEHGWTWESHILLSVRQGLHLSLVSARGEHVSPEHLPAGHTDEGWWARRASAISRFCFLQWLPHGKQVAEERAAFRAPQVAAPSFIPRGGDSWMWWEPGGATRVTHWDPISITCPTPGADIHYKVDINYDEAWALDNEDPEPYITKWKKYTG